VGGDDRLDQGQAESGAALVAPGAGDVAAREPLEGVLGQSGRKPGAVVVHDETVRLRAHRDRGAAGGVLAGIGQQVGHHL